MLWQSVKGKTPKFFTYQLDTCQLLEEGLPSQNPTFNHGMRGHLARKEQAKRGEDLSQVLSQP